MTVETPPGVINDVSTDAKIWRRTTQILAGGAVGAFAGGIGATNGGAHGVAGSGHLAVSQSGSPGMSVDVAAGLALITGTVSAEQGPYSFYNDAAVTLSIAAADSTNPRKDLVIAQVRDDDYSGADADARLTVVTGTPALSPSDPSLSSYPNALVLARIDVPAGDVAITDGQITDLRTRAGAYYFKQEIVKVGQAIGTTNASGNGHTDFGFTFPTVPQVFIQVADQVDGYVTVFNPATTSGFDWHASSNSTDAAVVSSAIRFNWLAICSA